MPSPAMPGARLFNWSISGLRLKHRQRSNADRHKHSSADKPEDHITVEALEKPSAHRGGDERQARVAGEARRRLDLLVALKQG